MTEATRWAACATGASDLAIGTVLRVTPGELGQASQDIRRAEAAMSYLAWLIAEVERLRVRWDTARHQIAAADAAHWNSMAGRHYAERVSELRAQAEAVTRAWERCRTWADTAARQANTTRDEAVTRRDQLHAAASVAMCG
ncbi:MAG: hypothetical protein Q4G34_01570 [Micrococcus sp.]|nr:hypothetical protein [Micrococcus sp.]